ncbi:unnamed protein product [Notodromas monacha]|uniref:Uncharacterized protein n=1 Tax=Notodromas monacha TaxID=399045 RepID=A0A7R9BQP1_9CRUS|nr:unnamed protein product [Notodromas monacha]CAG0919921.1 unnamed protein product [Notodromas monacha]
MRHPLTGVTSTHSLTSSSSATSFSSKYDTAPGMIPVPVTIKDPRMLEWMTEFDDGPQSSYVYRPTFLQFRSDDPEDDRFEDIKVRSEALERNEMNTYYSKVRREAPFHWLMICCNLYSVTYSSYLLYKFSEFGESYVRNNVKSPLVAHRYLQCHVLCVMYKVEYSNDLRKIEKFVSNLMRHMASQEQG